MDSEYKLVENETSLIAICNQFKGSEWLAIDTEFEREKTFYPELCLVQIATENQVVVIDPLLVENLQPLLDLLYDPSITKVFHAARQDIEIFFMLQGEVPEPLFDTQIAAPLVGYDEQIGYGNLVNKVLGISLSKAHTRTDWKRRPLQESQLQYAADDVIYLVEVYRFLIKKLKEYDRLSWLEDDFSALANPQLYQPDPETVWSKIRAAKKLKGNKLSTLQQLAAWRERTARAENRPKNWLIKDDTLVDLSQLQPGSLSDLGRIKGLNERLVRRYGQDLLKLIDVAKQQPPLPLEKARSHKALNVQEELKVDALTVLVRLLAYENNLNATTLAPRKELEKFVRNDSESTLFKGWREHLIGKELKAFLDGKSTIQLIDNEIICRKL